MTNKHVVLLLALAAILFGGQALIPYDGNTVGQRLMPPSLDGPVLGTDQIGRDVFWRTVSGLFHTISRAIVVLIGSCILGTYLSVFSVIFYKAIPDRMLVLVAEVIRSFPFIILLMLLIALKFPILPAFCLYYWIPIWRILRNAAASQLQKPYVLAAQSFGMRKWYVFLTQLIPNVWPRQATYLPAMLGEIIATMAALEFLGIGIDIQKASLGGMLLTSVQLGFRAVWCWLPSLVLLLIVVLGLVVVSNRLKKSIKGTVLG